MTTLDLRTERPECLDIGVSFTAKRGNSWKWNGVDRWWTVTTTILGFNGAGGYWVKEEWSWNGSLQTIKTDNRTLSAKESRDLDAAYEEAKQ